MDTSVLNDTPSSQELRAWKARQEREKMRNLAELAERLRDVAGSQDLGRADELNKLVQEVGNYQFF